MTPEKRAALAGACLAGMDHEVNARLAVIMKSCRAFCDGMPTHISTVDPRVTKFMQWTLQEMAVMQVIQGRLFARILDLLYPEGQGGEASHASEGTEKIKEGATDEANAGAGGTPGEPPQGRRVPGVGGPVDRHRQGDPISLVRPGQ